MATIVSGALSGRVYVDSLLWGGSHWSSGATGTTANVTYALDPGFSGWSAAQSTAMSAALQSWSAVANISFTQVVTPEVANLREFVQTSAQIGGTDLLGYHDVPVRGDFQLQGFFNGSVMTTAGLAKGGADFGTFVHEIGHGLGLAHPHDNGGGSSVFPGVTSEFGSYGTNNLNQGIFTVMSYNEGWTAKMDPTVVGSAFGYVGGPMAFDIAAIQYLYGANTTARTGSDTDVLPDANVAGTYWTCIWDAGGNDTIAYRGT
jgi:hypothetical protein